LSALLGSYSWRLRGGTANYRFGEPHERPLKESTFYDNRRNPSKRILKNLMEHIAHATGIPLGYASRKPTISKDN